MTETESIKSKINKLLAMAHDTRGNENECDAALRQAEKMMRKHNIDLAEIQDRTGVNPVYQWTSISIPAGAPVPVKTSPAWFGFLITGIGKFTDTKVAYTRPENFGICAKFSGDAVDVEYAGWLCKNLRDAIRRQSANYPGTKTEKESFRKAFALQLHDRMRALLIERQAELKKAITSTGNALIVVNQKIALRDAEYGEQRYGRARSVRLAPGGAEAGRAAADRASLNRPLSGGQARAQLSY